MIKKIYKGWWVHVKKESKRGDGKKGKDNVKGSLKLVLRGRVYEIRGIIKEEEKELERGDKS